MLLAMLQLGRVDYATATALQQTLVGLRKQQRIPDTLLLLEHPPLLTLGRNSGRANVVASDALLAERGVAVYETNRGGDVTYHGPGQLVGYPILDLRATFASRAGAAPLGACANSASPETTQPRLGAVDYVRRLEDAIIRTCGELGVPTQRICGRTGVWTLAQPEQPEKKVCAIGVHISAGITSHGFALNLDPNLADFDLIVPCGIADRGVTGLRQEMRPPHELPTLEALGNAVARNLGWALGRQVLALDSLQALLETEVAGFCF
jgi:lipoyl(octanoyl) transferase